MKLLDVAAVTTKPSTGDWARGWDGDARACAGVSVYLSECDPAATSTLIGEPDGPGVTEDCGYRVIPFGVVAALRRNTRSARDDDAQWLERALRESAEIPVARGLLIQQGMGLTLAGPPASDVVSDVWVGNPSVDTVAAPDLANPSATAAAIAEGRAIFFRKTIGVQPILHVNPGNAAALKNAGVLMLDPVNGEDRTIWGDQVVISEGYADIPGMTANPVAFWTAPLEVTLSETSLEEIIRATRQNKLITQVTMIAAIDTPPCAIVRIGAAPVPVPPVGP